MKLYHLKQSEVKGYDTFSDCVVCAESEEEASKIHPIEWIGADENPWSDIISSGYWCSSPDRVKVRYLGEAAKGIKKGIICSSFHAG